MDKDILLTVKETNSPPAYGSDEGADGRALAQSVETLENSVRPVVLSVQNVTKSFTLYNSGMHRFWHWMGLPVKPREVVHITKDVSFDVRKGEAIALIGQNGAGKSTLLKLITGTMRPTKGRIDHAHSISAILELGLGFNSEFTGRENVRLSGGMLGHSPAELEALMPDIEAFAEIGEFFDKPLRTYSSGMQARLAFALATATQPDILIVDEVLSVGDAYFQHKSFARIREFRDNGCTIILVTHALPDVRELCDRVLLIDKGVVLRDGPPDEVIDYYNVLITEKQNAILTLEQRRNKNGWSVTRSGDFRAVVKDIRMFSAPSGKEIATARVGEKVLLKTDVDILGHVPQLVLGLMIRDRTGHVVWGTNTWFTRQAITDISAGERLTYTLEFECALGPGSYSVSPALVSSDTHLENNYEWTDNLFVFDVINTDKDYFIGTTMLDASFSVDRGTNG
ncbi:ABC transporter ATP-binding protein [uncultured Hyphomonas sp.]|jgi:lipopolysaccharide transport system ATP-binding protein|uniref:ABC transporter ATP-binding protein n=1 Tax=uncultured Hyphomonas sp. TaxID=225298 RepID=UPI0030D7D605|tara:strand:+ start:3403 stop:4764 length:1362 start_codon:yes stop_codon:yes gene_type:complete